MAHKVVAWNSWSAVSLQNLMRVCYGWQGAAECVLERCSAVQLKDGSVVPLTPSFRENIIGSVEAMACKGLRVLACAFKSDLENLADYTGPKHPAHGMLINAENYSSIESQLTFVGLAGLQVVLL